MQYQWIGFWVQVLVYLYVFDGNFVQECVFQVNEVQYFVCVSSWCVGQQDFVFWQGMQQLGEVVFCVYYGVKVVKVVGFGKEIIGVDVMMVDYVQNCGVIVVLIVYVDLVGSGVVCVEYMSYICCYQLVDLWKDGV